MILRNFKKEDAPIIAEWLRSEEELYKWSADRFNKYPLTGEDINENYAPQIESGRFYPLTAVDENETKLLNLCDGFMFGQKNPTVPDGIDGLCTNVKGCPEGRSSFGSGSSNRGEQHPCWHTIFRRKV